MSLSPLFERFRGAFGGQGRFGRSAIVMIAGTMIAQTIPLAISPILTRIFSPSDFGVLALYMAAMSIASILAAGRYDLAVMLVHDERDADALVLLSCTIALALGALTALLVLLFGEWIAGAVKRPELGPWLYSLPVGLTLTGGYNAFSQWLNRRAQYGRLSRNRVVQSVVSGGSTIAFGRAGLGYSGMLSGALLGLAASTLLLAREFLSGRWRTLASGDMIDRGRRLAAEYKRHPLHIMPAQWIGVFSMQLPVFIAAAVFGPAIAGFYHFAYRVIGLPASLLGTAVGDVYRQHASEAYRANGHFSRLHLLTMAGMALLGCIPLAVLVTAAPWLFAVIFGAEWRVAGEYAQIMSLAAFVQFVFLPVDKAALIIGATRYIMAWNIVMMVLLGGLAYLTMTHGLGVKIFIAGITVVMVVMYTADGVIQYNYSLGAGMWRPRFKLDRQGESRE